VVLDGYFFKRFNFLGPAAFGGRALAGLAGLLGPAGSFHFALGLPLRGTLTGP